VLEREKWKNKPRKNFSRQGAPQKAKRWRSSLRRAAFEEQRSIGKILMALFARFQKTVVWQ